ncbi:MAG: nitrate/nitrite transporter NrtS [Chroococcales cyanobacterium]
MLKDYLKSLGNPKFRPVAAKVAILVGSILFTINHGSALIQGKMTRGRWISGILTYVVPYCVSIHGQYTNRSNSS